jgi:hypothetical protein
MAKAPPIIRAAGAAAPRASPADSLPADITDPQVTSVARDANQKVIWISMYCYFSRRWRNAKFKQKYEEARAKRAAREDHQPPPNPNLKIPVYRPLGRRRELAPAYQPIVLPASDFTGKDLFQIPFSYERGPELVACQAGNIIFYPLKQLGVYARALSWRCADPSGEWLAAPLNNRNCLLPIVFTNATTSGVGWTPHRGDKRSLFRSLSDRIHPTITFSELKEPIPQPAKRRDPRKFVPKNDPPDSYYGRLATRARSDRQLSLISLPAPEKIDLSALTVTFERDGKFYGCKVGGLVFWPLFHIPHLTRKRRPSKLVGFYCFGASLSSGLEGLDFGFRFKGLPGEVLQRCREGWCPFCPDRSKVAGVIIRLVQHAIDPRLPTFDLGRPFHTGTRIEQFETLSQAIRRFYARQYVPKVADPAAFVHPPDPADIPAFQLSQKFKAIREAGRPIAVAQADWKGKPLDQIPLVFQGDGTLQKSCRVGNLTLYPRRTTTVFVRGEDLCPHFDGLVWGFRLSKTVPQVMSTDKCFISTDKNWFLYGRKNPEFLPVIIGLIRHAIDPAVPAPRLNVLAGAVREDDTLDGGRGELLWQAMLRSPREEFSTLPKSLVAPDGPKRAETWLPTYIESVLQNKAINDDKKKRTVEKAFTGEGVLLPFVDWKMLAAKAELLPPGCAQLVQAAKRAAFVNAVAEESPEVKLFEDDPEMMAISRTDAFQREVADLKAQLAEPEPPEGEFG